MAFLKKYSCFQKCNNLIKKRIKKQTLITVINIKIILVLDFDSRSFQIMFLKGFLKKWYHDIKTVNHEVLFHTT